MRIFRTFTFRKIVELILTLFLVTIISFLLMKISPVDPAEAYSRRTFSVFGQEQVDQLREQMGLNQPLLIQYGNWVRNAFHLDFGTSLFNGHDVLTAVSNAMRISLSIVLLAALIQAVGILLVGSLCYLCHARWPNILLTALCIAGVSLPPFFFASTFIDIFAVNFRWLSVTSNSGIARYLPAAICLSISGIAFYSQLLAKNIEHEMNEDYAMYARKMSFVFCCSIIVFLSRFCMRFPSTGRIRKISLLLVKAVPGKVHWPASLSVWKLRQPGRY